MKKIRVVVATREKLEDFSEKTATGISLKLTPFDDIETRVYAENTVGLSAIYNKEIELAKHDPAILVFAHDDLLITNFFWRDEIRYSLEHFDIVGVAGNKRRCPGQPSWFFLDTSFKRDNLTNMSGVVGHGKTFPPSNISFYGPPGQEVKLLDGLILWADSEDLHETGLRFDEQFQFHFYDMDFCRSAEKLGLRMGTWPFTVVHQSRGGFNSPSWKAAYMDYLKKWGS